MAKSHAHGAALRQVLKVFALFAVPVRVVIFQRLAARPMTAGELARELPVKRTAVVQHLKRFEAVGLVAAHSEGRRRVYRLVPEGLKPLHTWLRAYAPARHRAETETSS